jgi:CheY-like chemotaxis protein
VSLSKNLLVDDETINQSLIVGLLEGLYEINAVDGAESYLLTIYSWMPDLILLDVNMPGISSLDLCRQLKSLPELEAVLIMFISADKYIGRPFSNWELLKTI